jgi:hypothetical protein
MKCKICHRPLKDAESIAVGMGPVCRGYYARHGKSGKGDQNELFNNHAVFALMEDNDSFVYIQDRGHNQNCRTVTNDAEYVLAELDDLIDNLEKKRVFYMDSDGQVDEIIHEGKKFKTFKAGHSGVSL